MSIYLDGTQVLSSTSSGLRACANPASASNVADIDYHPTSQGRTKTFYVGRNGATSAAYDFDGKIDEVRVYDRVLTPGEILSIAQGAM
jgi:hypothetical protein